jgi:hypothetical protein
MHLYAPLWVPMQPKFNFMHNQLVGPESIRYLRVHVFYGVYFYVECIIRSLYTSISAFRKKILSNEGW